ncbi:meprin A subunit beta-like [Gouania willdenowi]|uniref:Metalloendopeptidase n=1 Tax=Gouania willdenowi TaxID=441366 RepID=A0A8C5ENB9_GOUWI|nr:meprin A subunit beta-like [Gouania willdenowi]
MMYNCIIVVLCTLHLVMSHDPMWIEMEVGNEQEAPEINEGLEFFEGDIVKDAETRRRFARNAVVPPKVLWDIPVPVKFEDSLDLNTKAVILQAFDHFRLKTCIDFKVRDDEEWYLSARKNGGCYSYVSRRIKDGQVVSIGLGCERLGTVEHEFIHALGLFHEQSRYDRDDYINIMWDNIQYGEKRNFFKLTPQTSTTFGAPYDYESVMHYGRRFFTKNYADTIVTKDPDYQDKIGQRNEMSPWDVYKVNRLYNCTTTTYSTSTCHFTKADICGMKTCEKGSIEGWKRVGSAAGGPDIDSTTMDRSPGFFMHASTALGDEGDSAWLETTTLTPTRKCHIQCLQFYYYNSGSQTDQLNIWIREFTDGDDSTETLHLMDSITGPQTSVWKFHTVSLYAENPFQVVFEVRKGNENSTGGYSIDDMYLSEAECPNNVWQIDNFEELLTTSDFMTYLHSPRFYSYEGYAYQLIISLQESFFGIGFRLVAGRYDFKLKWPLNKRQVNIIMVDQNPDPKLHVSKQMTFTTDASKIYNNPSIYGKPFIRNGKLVLENPGFGSSLFLNLKQIRDHNFLKGGAAVFLSSITDISSLEYQDYLPCPKRDNNKSIKIYEDTVNIGSCSNGALVQS